jgi:hypothetical protein
MLRMRDVAVGRALELFELMRYISRIDQALELGALYVIAGSGVETQGYARGDRTSRGTSSSQKSPAKIAMK